MGTYLRAKIDPSSYFSFSYPGILGNITRNFRLAGIQLLCRDGITAVTPYPAGHHLLLPFNIICRQNCIFSIHP